MFAPRLESAGPHERSRYRARLLRRRRLSSAALIVASLPSMVLAGVVVARVGGLLGPSAIVVSLGVWLLSGVPVLFFAATVESVRPGGKADTWTAAQASRLTPAWRDVVAVTGICEDDYLVLITKSREVNGCARHSWIIEVTNGAVRKLRRPQLNALLAHELGHLMSSRRSSSFFLAGWYALPWYLGPFLLSAVLAIPAAFADRGVLAKLATTAAELLYLGAMAGLLILLFSPRQALVAAALLTAQMLGKRLVSRRDERTADLVAVDLGFGAGALELLREHGHDLCIGHATVPWLDRLSHLVAVPLSTHPPVRSRIRTIESRIHARIQSVRPSADFGVDARHSAAR